MNTDSRWIWAVVARCALYSASLGGAFLLLGALLFGSPLALFLWLDSRQAPEFDTRNGLGQLILVELTMMLIALITAIGAIGGAISGFYSPPREEWFPPHSTFFRRILKSGLLGFFLGVGFGCLMGFVCRGFRGIPELLVGASPFCGQIYGTARGLNLARRAALSLPDHKG